MKILFVGNARTRKTNIASRLANPDLPFSHKYNPTSGLNVFYYKSYTIYDFAGQESLINSSYRFLNMAEVGIIFTSQDEENNPVEYGNKSVEYYEQLLRKYNPNITIFKVFNTDKNDIKKLLSF